MLRAICFKNFINFQNFHSMQFKAERPIVFIGANATGKSSVNELIRRCMTNDLNATVSASYDDNEPAYVFCTFDKFIDAIEKKLCSGVMKYHGEITKILWWRESAIDTPHLQLYTSDMHFKGSIKYDQLIEKENATSVMIKIIEEGKEESADKLINFIREYGNTELIDFHSVDQQKGHAELKSVQSMYVATLSHRSLGVCQWTRSASFCLKNKQYETAVERAEMLTFLMNLADIGMDKIKAEQIFKNIISPSGFRFDFSDDRKLVKITDENSGKKFDLLKCPEGVIEAKIFSLLISMKHIYTIFLEEPDRGMHPQYVERLRNWLSKESVNKTILTITHNPYLINTTTAENAFVFFRVKSMNAEREPYSFLPLADINRQITDTDELKKIIFASKVLFVEGKTDKIVLEGIYNWYMKRPTKSSDFETESIVNRQIVVLGGKGNTAGLPTFCKSTFINYAWLFDRNKYVEIEKKTNRIKKVCVLCPSLNYKRYENTLLTDLTSNETDFPSLLADVEQQREFCWKNGDLEDAIKCSLDEDDFIEIFHVPKNQISKDEVKAKINGIDRGDLEKLIHFLMKGHDDDGNKSDFFRFGEFLRKMEKFKPNS